MKTDVIYEPKGRALEYSPLAFNIFRGCPHACKYCYAPLATHSDRADFHERVHVRKNILERLEKDCGKLEAAGEDRQILMCFSCDPYPHNMHELWHYTRAALEILYEHGQKVAILTKGGVKTVKDFSLLRRDGCSYGTTLTFRDEQKVREWEPHSASPESRMAAIEFADRSGIHTFVSLEPVIDPAEALGFIRELKAHVDLWKIGPLNYNKDAIAGVDWDAFVADVRRELPGGNYYLKNELLNKLTQEEKHGDFKI